MVLVNNMMFSCSEEHVWARVSTYNMKRNMSHSDHACMAELRHFYNPVFPRSAFCASSECCTLNVDFGNYVFSFKDRVISNKYNHSITSSFKVDCLNTPINLTNVPVHSRLMKVM